VDGERGELILAGYRVEDIASRVSFEEMTYLLWTGRLPDSRESAAWTRRIGEKRKIPPSVLELVTAAAAAGAPPMPVLRTAISSLGFDPDRDDLGLLAAFPTIVGAWVRARSGETVLEPDPALGHAADLLRMVSGAVPSPARARALDTYLIATIDHGLNASTFAARVVISTRSDMAAAVTGAIGALQGPLHGGAPGPVLDLLHEVSSQEDRLAFLRAKVERGERLMGFGHRIYRVRDPRADVLARACEALRASGEAAPLFDLALDIEKIALDVLEEHKPDRALKTNVEFYTALLLQAVGVPKDAFTAIFATSRVAGWIAHAREQLATRKLIRPQSNYVGPRPGPGGLAISA
jgi:citrate synthase